MAVQTYPYLVITDGTTTVTIQDGLGAIGNYPLMDNGWAPAIAGLRASPLAGVSPYDDVEETLRIEIHESTAALALAKLATLQKLLEQAARWYRGENETAVLLKFAPAGSTVSSTAAPLQAAILGGGAGGEMGLRLTPEWSDVSFNYVIKNVVITLTRRGLWLHTTTEAHSPSAADNGELVTFTLTARDVKCPTKLAFTNFAQGWASSERYSGVFVLVGDQVSGSAPIAIINAESGTGTAFTSVNPSLNARNTNVLRYTPTLTSEVQSGALTAPSLPATTRLVAVFVNVRPSATITFTVRLRLDSVILSMRTPHVVIAPDTNQASRWVFLGVVPISGAISNTYLYVTASAASSSLDIDTVVFADAEAVQVVGCDSAEAPVAGYFNTVVGTGAIDHRLLTKPTGSFVDDSTPMLAKGDMAIMTKAASVYAVLLGTGGGSTASKSYGNFRQSNPATDAAYQNTWTATRSTGYLVPQ